jgi:signal transduction histidine kinase
MRGPSLRLGIGIVGTVIAVGAEIIAVSAAGRTAGDALLDAAIGLTYLYGGLAIWNHEPANRTGPKMTAVGLTWFIGAGVGSGIPVLDVFGQVFQDTSSVFLLTLVLAYPGGRLVDRVDQAAIWILAIGVTAINAVNVVPVPLILNQGSNGLYGGLALAIMTTGVIIRRWVIAPARAKRSLLPVLFAGLVFLITLTINIVRRIFEVPDDVAVLLVAAKDLAPAAVPIALLVGFFRQSELRTQALIDAIPDRIIRITRDGWPTNVRAGGAPPGASPTALAVARAFDAREGRVSDQALVATQRALDEGGLQSFDFSIDTEIGRREFEARITASGPDEVTAIIRDFTDQRAADAELRRSRARIVEATDAERRRLERDLHDGAQQRLVSLSLSLRLLRSRLADAEAVAAVDDIASELKLAISELRELARGIHPAILTEAGLGPAISSLADRSPVPTVVTALPDRRLAPGVEATAYFVVSEALANIAKHASATRAGVGATCDGSVLTVEISDDGVGGADRDRGSGLAGLEDRVAALGGRLSVDSAAGQGTRVVAEIPFG